MVLQMSQLVGLLTEVQRKLFTSKVLESGPCTLGCALFGIAPQPDLLGAETGLEASKWLQSVHAWPYCRQLRGLKNVQLALPLQSYSAQLVLLSSEAALS